MPRVRFPRPERKKASWHAVRLTKLRRPRVLYSKAQPFQVDLKNIFADFEESIRNVVGMTRPLAKEQALCSTCERYDWIIPPGNDRLRYIVARGENIDVFLSTGSAASRTSIRTGLERRPGEPAEPVWLATELPTGSLFDLLRRPRCRVCILVLHLMTPLPITSLSSWAAKQSLAVLQGLQYAMQFDHSEKILVRMKQPAKDIWQEIGAIKTRTNMEYETLTSVSFARTRNIEYKTVEDWLQRCDKAHQHCRENRSQGRKNIQIRLVDVIDRCVISGTLESEFIALSYVWGGIESLKTTKENLAILEQKHALLKYSALVPICIRDAMTVVSELKQRYLWVDSLCIVQNDGMEKHDQISLMHEIYTAAYATIVQHAGCDANAGLPGVRNGSRSHIAMKTHVVDQDLIAQTNYVAPNILSSSIHSTRGWTMQEVLLSTRCLHFFNNQITFVCGEEWAQDWNCQCSGWEESSEVLSCQMKRLSHDMWQMNPFSSVPNSDAGNWRDAKISRWLRYFGIYGQILTEYTIRSLSFESDTIPAFQGLGGAITRLNGARFYFGVPSNCFDLALLWINLGPGTKRSFKPAPSWSWAAWTGRTTYNLTDLAGDRSQPCFINSYLKHIYVKEERDSIEIARVKFARKTSRNIDYSTPYFTARSLIKDPEPDRRLTQDLPPGCLHFWAEECAMGQLSIDLDRAVPSIEIKGSGERCGVLAPSIKTQDIDVAGHAEYSLILMSESREVLPHWMFGTEGFIKRGSMATTTVRMEDFDYPEYYEHGGHRTAAWMFNVLLVKRDGTYFERVAFGQVHMLAWLEMKRRRRYIRLV